MIQSPYVITCLVVIISCFKLTLMLTKLYGNYDVNYKGGITPTNLSIKEKKENDASWHDIKISFVGNNNWSWQVLNCNNSCLFLFYKMFYNTLQRHDKFTKTRCVKFKLCLDRYVWSTNYEWICCFVFVISYFYCLLCIVY